MSDMGADIDVHGKGTILHYVNLNVIGGVESLFYDLVRSGSLGRSFRNEVISGTNVHARFQKEIRESVDALWFIKHTRGGVYVPRVPGWFRRARARVLAKHVRPTVVVAWNTLGRPEVLELKRGCQSASLLYLEHGAAWDADPVKSRSFLRQCDQIVCNSQAAKRVMEERFGVTVDRVMRVPLRPGVLQGSGDSRAKIIPGNRPLRMGIAGRHVSVKGFNVSLYTLRALIDLGHDVELHVAGTGPRLQEFCTLGERLGLTNRVRILGHVSDMSGFFARIDVLLMPSIREPFGLVSVEAAARGCVVIAAGVDGLPETMIDGETGVLVEPTESISSLGLADGGARGIPNRVYEPKSDGLVCPKVVDPAAVAGVVEGLIEDPGRFARMSGKAMEYARIAHDFSSYADSLDAVLVGMAAVAEN